MKTRKRLICFDLDNTLVHAGPAHLAAYKLAFKENGVPAPTTRQLLRHFGLIAREIVRRVAPKLKKQQVVQILEDHHVALMTTTYRKIKPIRGAKRVLRRLKKQGYELVITTNCETTTAKKILSAAGIPLTLFDAIVTNENVKHPKPAPDEIVKAQHLMHLRPDYMVGDTPYDIIAARKAGVRAIAVVTGDHTRTQLQREKPYAILKSVAALPKFLKREHNA